MANAKETTKAASEKKEQELLKALEEMKKEFDKALKRFEEEKAALIKENEDLKKKTPEPKEVHEVPEHDEAYWKEKVPFTAFYDGGEYSDDLIITVNGRKYQIQRGVEVEVPRFVVHAYENSMEQQRQSARYNKQLQDEFERDTKKYLGE